MTIMAPIRIEMYYDTMQLAYCVKGKQGDKEGGCYFEDAVEEEDGIIFGKEWSELSLGLQDDIIHKITYSLLRANHD